MTALEKQLLKALELALSAFDNSLRSAGTSTAGFIASRRLMAKAQREARVAVKVADLVRGHVWGRVFRA